MLFARQGRIAAVRRGEGSTDVRKRAEIVQTGLAIVLSPAQLKIGQRLIPILGTDSSHRVRPRSLIARRRCAVDLAEIVEDVLFTG